MLLLISGLDISHDELAILEQIYSESRVHPTRMDNQFELVWIPIVDRSLQWTDAMQRQFETVQSTMPWYSVYHPSLIDRSVIRFIKEKWHFRNKPILVVMDGQGRVLCPNAIHMMWIWGSAAFPFTSTKEEALWKDETWRLELLVDGIDPRILEWVCSTYLYIDEINFLTIRFYQLMFYIKLVNDMPASLLSCIRHPYPVVHIVQILLPCYMQAIFAVYVAI